jgi:hypothetical protein
MFCLLLVLHHRTEGDDGFLKAEPCDYKFSHDSALQHAPSRLGGRHWNCLSLMPTHHFFPEMFPGAQPQDFPSSRLPDPCRRSRGKLVPGYLRPAFIDQFFRRLLKELRRGPP